METVGRITCCGSFAAVLLALFSGCATLRNDSVTVAYRPTPSIPDPSHKIGEMPNRSLLTAKPACLSGVPSDIVLVSHDDSKDERVGSVMLENQEKGTPETFPAPRTIKPGTVITLSAPSGMTLDQIINATLIADPKLRSGFEVINQANADALTASLKPNPDLFTDIQLLPLTRPFTVDRQGGPPQQDINFSYPIDWFLFGKRAAAMQAAGLGVRVSEAEYAEVIRQRVLEAATGYYDVLEAKALLDLARQDVENLKHVENFTEKAVKGGGRPLVELNRIRLDRLKSEQMLRDAENALVAAKARLRALLGRDDNDAAFDVAGELDQKVTIESLSVEEAFTVAQQNRPDVQSLRWKVSQAQADIESERRKAYPSVTPQVGYTRQYQEKAIGFPDANSYSLALTMSLPFHDRNQGNQAKATSVMVQNQFELQSRIVSLRAEVVQADKELLTTAANFRAVAGEHLKVAEEVRDATNKAYEAGGRPLIDVLDAQRNYRETYRLFITSRAGYGRATVKYDATLGIQIAP